MLTISCAFIECLDKNQKPLLNATASGFIRRENGVCFLYTCWHVVTGFNPYSRGGTADLLRRRRYLRVSLQDAKPTAPGSTLIGGVQSLVVPLYEEKQGILHPLWLQDELDTPHVELNGIGLRKPFWHDAIKLALPPTLAVSDIQLIDESRIHGSNSMMVLPGDKTLVVGFPHGYSSVGMDQPTPVVLTRFVAGISMSDRPREFLLESIGSPGMSGGPVYIDTGKDVLLVGIYTGSISPDNLHPKPEKATALGTAADLTFLLHGHLPLIRPAPPPLDQ